jgi:prepilin-type N-terminal cleavage/methylation domain-containing protein/prepilin-type processing-associated H-X9-DG protein
MFKQDRKSYKASCCEAGPTRGFTLVELLVVIGIIALLISILLPALSKARSTAMRTVCLARMKELNNACMLYATENRGTLPPIWNYSDLPPVHFGRPAIFSTTADPVNDCYLTRYLGNGDTQKRYICPLLDTYAGYSTTTNQSYRYNQIVGGYRGAAIQTQTGPGSGYYYAYPYKLAQLRQGGRVGLWMDSDTIANGFGNGGNSMWFRQDSTTISSTVGSSYNWANMQGSLQLHGKSTSNTSYIGYAGGTYPSITGITNVAFADGSVRTVPVNIKSYPVAFQGSDFPTIDPDYITPKW